jgi:hypothetical protein
MQAIEILDVQAREEIKRIFVWKEKWSIMYYG